MEYLKGWIVRRTGKYTKMSRSTPHAFCYTLLQSTPQAKSNGTMGPTQEKSRTFNMPKGAAYKNITACACICLLRTWTDPLPLATALALQAQWSGWYRCEYPEHTRKTAPASKFGCTVKQCSDPKVFRLQEKLLRDTRLLILTTHIFWKTQGPAQISSQLHIATDFTPVKLLVLATDAHTRANSLFKHCRNQTVSQRRSNP